MAFNVEIQALVAFGANLPSGNLPPEKTIIAAVGALAAEGLTLCRLSRLYRTPCFPTGSGPDYVNAAAILTLRQDLSAVQVLAALHRVEAQFGRERQLRWGRRTLDIDLLALGDSVLPDITTQSHWRELPPDMQRSDAPEHLVLPHPRLQDRAFVLVPLADVAPDWVHPVMRMSVKQMLAALSQADREQVVPIDPAAAV